MKGMLMISDKGWRVFVTCIVGRATYRLGVAIAWAGAHTHCIVRGKSLEALRSVVFLTAILARPPSVVLYNV